MTYIALNAAFAIPIAVVAITAWKTRRGRLPRWRAYAVALLVLVIDTAIFDNVLIALGIVDYNPDRILGVKLWLAPVEDFAYSIGACILLPALWALIPPKKTAGHRTDDKAPDRSSGTTRRIG